MYFVTSLANQIGYKSIKTYLFGIQFHMVQGGHQCNLSEMQLLYYTLRGIRRTQGTTHNRPKRLPVTTHHLLHIKQYLANSAHNSHNKRLLWAAVTIAFFGLLRVSEYTAQHVSDYDPSSTLLITDVTFDSTLSCASITLRASKTDPFRQGCCVRIGATGNALCPVSALWHFRHWCHHQAGPLFTFADGSFLTRHRIAALFTECLPSINLSTHSLRIGGASALASAGHSDSSIMLLGRWTSSCFQRYLRISDSTIRKASCDMARAVVYSHIWDASCLTATPNR